MSSTPMRLLYVYEERIPSNLQQLVINSIPVNEFLVDRMTYTSSDAEKIEKMRWADVVLFAPGRYLSESVLQNASHIKLMQLWSSGYDKFNCIDTKKLGIPVANNGGANAISVAEHTILLMLAVNKWLPDSHRRTVEGKWAGNSHGMDMFLLNGKTLGLVGFGNIGKEVARRAAAFGMQTLYVDPIRATQEVELALNATHCDLDTLLSDSDIVSLHLHLNQSTIGMIGKRELGLMRRGAMLVNVSRAELVDREALLDALQTGQLRGVGLDVYDKEPTHPNDPLVSHPHVVATPHMAGSTYDAYVTAMRNCIGNLLRVKRGEQPLWVVNGVK